MIVMYTGAIFGEIAGVYCDVVNIDSYCGIRIGVGSANRYVLFNYGYSIRI
jgi:hypothetical protein